MTDEDYKHGVREILTILTLWLIALTAIIILHACTLHAGNEAELPATVAKIGRE